MKLELVKDQKDKKAGSMKPGDIAIVTDETYKGHIIIRCNEESETTHVALNAKGTYWINPDLQLKIRMLEPGETLIVQ